MNCECPRVCMLVGKATTAILINVHSGVSVWCMGAVT